MKLCDERLGDETLMNNVIVVICQKLKTTKFRQLMVTDVESCEFFVFVMSCFVAGYELAKDFMSGDV